jgi:hypothetical protein
MSLLLSAIAMTILQRINWQKENETLRESMCL